MRELTATEVESVAGGSVVTQGVPINACLFYLMDRAIEYDWTEGAKKLFRTVDGILGPDEPEEPSPSAGGLRG